MDAGSLQLDHAALPIRDVEASLYFYRELLGLPLVDALSGDDWGGFPWLMMILGLADGRQLALCAFQGACLPGAGELPDEARHLALGVRSSEELASWKRKLEAAGLSFSEEEHGVQHSLYFQDPSGNVLELTAPPTPGAGSVDAGAGDVVARWLRSIRKE